MTSTGFVFIFKRKNKLFLFFHSRLDSNPLNCTCEILWLTRLLKQTPNTENAATCQEPEHLRGKPLVRLTPQNFNCSKSLVN